MTTPRHPGGNERRGVLEALEHQIRDLINLPTHQPFSRRNYERNRIYSQGDVEIAYRKLKTDYHIRYEYQDISRSDRTHGYGSGIE